MKNDRSDINFIHCSRLEADLFLIEKRYQVNSSGHGMDITGPCLIYSKSEVPKSLDEVAKFFRTHEPTTVVALQSNPSRVARKVKSFLDQKYNQDLTMSMIAKKLKTSSAVISRQFKSSYGFTPMSYKRGLRVTVAMFYLLSGRSAADSASLAGYNDLGRFYKQFKEYIRLTPESHRIKKSQKTPRRRPDDLLQTPQFRRKK